MQIFSDATINGYAICKVSLSTEEREQLVTSTTIQLYDEVIVEGTDLYDGKNALTPRLLDVEENYKRIADRVAQAAVRSGRQPEDVSLLAATQNRAAPNTSTTRSRAACALSAKNRVQELPGEVRTGSIWTGGVSCQMIGRLQTNKVKYIRRQGRLHPVGSTP